MTVRNSQISWGRGGPNNHGEQKHSKMTPDFCNDYKRIADGHGSNDNNKNNLNQGKFKLIMYINIVPFVALKKCVELDGHLAA